MSVEMAIWRMGLDGTPERLTTSALDLEARLESLVVADPALVGLDLLVIGNQVRTPFGGLVDVLGVDVDGRLHVIELKRDRTPRDVVAQTLDYGTWASRLTLDAVEDLFARKNDGADFDDAFAERFDAALPDVFNAEHQLTIVASELDPTSDRIVEYLAESYGVPLNAVFFRYYADGDREYLARTWLLAPEEAAAARATGGHGRKVQPWNGRDYYVILGRVETGGERWDVARRYGVLTAGGGAWYWKPLRNLEAGHRVFAYVGGAGYVGVGIVTGEIVPARDAVVETGGRARRLLELPDLPAYLVERGQLADDEQTEYVVPVRWLHERDLENAVTAKGLFASQVTVCRLRDERTIKLVTEAFGLVEGDS